MLKKTIDEIERNLEKTKAAIMKGAEKTKRLAEEQAAVAKDFAMVGATTTKDYAQKGFDATITTATIIKGKIEFGAAELYAFLDQQETLKWLEETTKQWSGGTASIYDKAMDAEYIKTHIGGAYHRFFDGGHDVFGAWERVRDATDDDTFAQEVIGYMTALWKDAVTPLGLPFETLNPETFHPWADRLADTIPGLLKSEIYDLLSFDAIDVIASGLGVVGAVFCLSKDDTERLSGILGAMGVQAVISANPIMGIAMIALTAYSLFVKKTGLDKTAMMKSGTVACVSAILFSILGFPLLIDFVIVIVLTSLFRRQVLNNDQLIQLIVRNAAGLSGKGRELALKIINQLQQNGAKPHNAMCRINLMVYQA